MSIYDLAKLKTFQEIEKKIILDEKPYTIKVQGSGKINCLCIGMGSLMQKTLSTKFKEIFTVYSTDLYWTNANKLSNPYLLTIDQIVQDLEKLIGSLGLQELVILAHSAFGIIALELAKKNHQSIKGIIMIGTPTACNEDVAKHANIHFEKYASKDRKANDLERKSKYQTIKKPEESEVSLNSYEAASARYWGDFSISREFLEELWKNVEIDEEICKHFFGNLLPNHNIANGIEDIKIPIILFGGELDFDCIPLELWKNHPKPKNFTIINCGKVGHWPNFEIPNLFDNEVFLWLKSNNLT